MDRAELYKQLYAAYQKANLSKPKALIQSEVNNIWNTAKQDPDSFASKIRDAIELANQKATTHKAALMKYWVTSTVNAAQKKGSGTGSSSSAITERSGTTGGSSAEVEGCPSAAGVKTMVAGGCSSLPEGSSPILRPNENLPLITPGTPPATGLKRPAPAQEKIRNQLANINDELLMLVARRDRDFLTDDDQKRMTKLKTEKKDLEAELKKKIGDQERSKKRRDELKYSLTELKEKIPEAKTILNIRPAPGRPRIEETQPELLKAIIDIAIHGSAAQGRRRDESFRSVKTLDELVDALKREGFQLSRTATYLRLLPRRANSTEGLRHVTTVPVKLAKAENDRHSQHPDGHFCTATISELEQLASLLGPREVFFMSQDDKARVAIGLTAANKQAPMIMHVEYRVSLPDHDFVVAKGHKLIPSVYAAISIKPDSLGAKEAVGYTGPTYIAIRSAKHCSSTAFSHGLDYSRLLHLPEFEEFIKSDGVIKPVHIVVSDGGPDENPRYQKVIKIAVHNFITYGLDALFIVTNAPGRSAYNRVERRMAPLSRELAGLILEHDHYGSHLDSQLRTTDAQLEAQNFAYAGKTLAAVWNNIRFDGYPVCSEYIEPTSSELEEEEIVEKDSDWFSQHVRSSQYCLQIVKCFDQSCCDKPRSSIFSVLRGRFLPPPVPLIQTEFGLKAPSLSNAIGKPFAPLFVLNSLNMADLLPNTIMWNEQMAFDTYCPSVQKNIKDRTCKVCKMYFASNVILKQHNKTHKTTEIEKKVRPKSIISRRGKEILVQTDEEVMWMDEEIIDVASSHPENDSYSEEDIQVISIDQHLQTVWKDD